jgi:hypothetical protein
MNRQGATYVDKIMRGNKPADLPVEQPTHHEMYLDLKTARALGIDVPTAWLARADEIIEYVRSARSFCRCSGPFLCRRLTAMREPGLLARCSRRARVVEIGLGAPGLTAPDVCAFRDAALSGMLRRNELGSSTWMASKRFPSPPRLCPAGSCFGKGERCASGGSVRCYSSGELPGIGTLVDLTFVWLRRHARRRSGLEAEYARKLVAEAFAKAKRAMAPPRH